MPFPFAIAAMAAMAAAQAAAAKKRQDAQNTQDAMTQAAQQANSGYTKSPPVNAKLGAPSSWTDAAVGAAGTTWAQVKAAEDQKRKEAMDAIYAKNAMAQTNAYNRMGYGGPQMGPQAQGQMAGPVQTPVDPVTGLPIQSATTSAWGQPGMGGY